MHRFWVGVLPALFGACAVALFPAAAGAACAAGNGVHAAFAQADAADWNASPRVAFGDGKLTITPGKNKQAWTTNQHGPFASHQICATVLNHAGEKSDEDGGIIFWAERNEDPASFFFFAITPLGEFGVFKHDRRGGSTVVGPKASSAIKRGADAPNELRLVLSVSGSSTAWTNGTKVATFDFDGATLLTYAGLTAESNTPVPLPWTFLGYDVSK